MGRVIAYTGPRPPVGGYTAADRLVGDAMLADLGPDDTVATGGCLGWDALILHLALLRHLDTRVLLPANTSQVAWDVVYLVGAAGGAVVETGLDYLGRDRRLVAEAALVRGALLEPPRIGHHGHLYLGHSSGTVYTLNRALEAQKLDYYRVLRP